MLLGMAPNTKIKTTQNKTLVSGETEMTLPKFLSTLTQHLGEHIKPPLMSVFHKTLQKAVPLAPQILGGMVASGLDSNSKGPAGHPIS